MYKGSGFSKLWYLVVLLVAFAAGCGEHNSPQANSGNAVTAFSLGGATGTINEPAKTIAVTVPSGTDVTALVASFTSTGGSLMVGTAPQTSGTTPNNFSSPVAYTVTAADGSVATYTVTVTVTSPMAITSFSVGGVAGMVDETAKTIAVTLPTGASRTSLAASFTTTGTSVTVGTVQQTSGITSNDFASPVAYTVSAADGSQTIYAVTVEVALASANTINAYALLGVTGTINDAAKTIAVTVPNGTNLAALVASFSFAGSSVTVGAAPQVSGSTPNNFTAPVSYTVTAADGTTATYTVTVSLASSSANAISAFRVAGVNAVIAEAAKTITVAVPNGTSLTALTASFTTTGTTVTVGSVVQTSGTTANNFSTPVAYTVTAADGSKAIYTVTVSQVTAKGPAPVQLGSAGDFAILAQSAVSTVPSSAILGDVGLSPAARSYLTGFSETMSGTTSATSTQVIGKLYAADMTAPTSTKLTTAIGDMKTAYTDAAGRPTPDFLNLGAGEIGGKTLLPGLYKWNTGVKVSSDVTLAGGPNDVWIFQISGTLTESSAKHVFLSGGASAKNIFWQVAGGATIGTTARFEGIILSKTSVILGTGASMTGRALAQTAVNLDATTITKPN